MPQEAARGLEPKQSTADDHRILAARRIGGDLVAVLEGAEDEEPLLRRAVLPSHPPHGRPHARRAGGEDELVVALGRPVHAVHDPRARIDARGAHAGVQLDLVLLVPGERIDEDVDRLVALGEHAGEQDAVVVAVGLVAEHGDLPALAAVPREQLLDEARARHPVADHHQLLLQLPPPWMRTAQTLNSGMRLTGSSAALVSRLAPSQWKETKTVSCRKNGLHSTVKRALPLRVESVTGPPSARPCRRAVSGWIRATGVGDKRRSSATRRVCVPDW